MIDFSYFSVGKQVLFARSVFLIFSLCLVYPLIPAQSLADYEIDVSHDDITLGSLIEEINWNVPGKIFCPGNFINLKLSRIHYSEITVANLLKNVLDPHHLAVLYHRDLLAVITSKENLNTEYTPAYYRAFEESLAVSENRDEGEIVVGDIDRINQSGESVVKGRVRDAETGEPVIGAAVLIEELQIGEATEVDGSFELRLNAGEYLLAVQYIGYLSRTIPIRIISSGTLDLELDRSTILLDEVVVQARALDENIQSTQVGVSRVSIRQIEKLPSFLGEVDIIRGLLLQAGVSTLGEGSSGFNVRGGNVDQNLIMIDEGIIFNASHALGFFGTFNSDIVSEAVLYKGVMPAIYGGRLASALDIKIRDGSFERFHLKGGLGLVSSRLNLDGPIKKDKTSGLVSIRSTYSDWILHRVKIPEVRNSSASFYDINARLSHRFNTKNNISLSLYQTADDFSFNEDFGFAYSTTMAQLHFRKVLGEQVLAATNLVWSRYNSEQEQTQGTDASVYDTGLEYVKFKENVSYLGENLQVNAGISAIKYMTDGNEIYPTSEESTISPRHLDDQKGLEWGFYGDLDLGLTPHLSLVGGLRYSLFHFFGPHNTYSYQDPSQPTLETIIEPIVENRNIIKSYGHLLPRLSVRLKISPVSSIKGGYGRTSQYINQIFNSETPTPTNFWQLSNQYIPPQLAHNYSLGYFINLKNNLWITSIEGFYRDIDQLSDYRDFADLLANDHLETELLGGIGRSYGMEMSVNKQLGTIHGWLNYTLSKSERKIEGINGNQWYPSNFDKTHDLNVVANFQINRRNSISLNFNFSTGRPITVPVNKYLVHNRIVVLNYSDRNAFRIPDYHRLDFSYTLAQGFRKSKKFKTSWTFSIYNLYARKNAYSVFVEQSSLNATKINRLSILGTAFPSLTFNFELL